MSHCPVRPHSLFDIQLPLTLRFNRGSRIRKRIWTRTRLTIEKLRPEDTPPTVTTTADAQVPGPSANLGPLMEPVNGPEGEHLKTGDKRPNPSTYAGSEGERKSKRIREAKLQGSTTLDLAVAHTDSVMDLKQQVSASI